jgi:hypothetical protein
MTDTTPIQTSGDDEAEEMERTRQQPAEDEGGSSRPPSPQGRAGSSDQRSSRGRKPLFGT